MARRPAWTRRPPTEPPTERSTASVEAWAGRRKLPVMKLHERRLDAGDDDEQIVEIRFRDRYRIGDSQRPDHLRQGVGVADDEHVAGRIPDCLDQSSGVVGADSD